MRIIDYKKEVGKITGFLCAVFITGKVFRRLNRCNRTSLDKLRFDGEGCDWQEHRKNEYNQLGLDRAKCDRKYYDKVIKQLRWRLDEAYQQLQQGQFRYAIYDARVVMGEALNLIVQHTNGTDGVGDTILANMKICERKDLFGADRESFDKLYEAHHICNFNMYKFVAEENMNHNKIYFVIMQIKDLLNLAESILVRI